MVRRTLFPTLVPFHPLSIHPMVGPSAKSGRAGPGANLGGGRFLGGEELQLLPEALLSLQLSPARGLPARANDKRGLLLLAKCLQPYASG